MRRASFCSALLFFAASALHAAPPSWVQSASKATVAPQSPSTTAVVLTDETVLTVGPSGELTTHFRRAVKVLTPAGRKHAYGAAGFDNNTKLRALRGWSIAPSGKIETLRERDAAELSAGDYEVYTDARVKILDMPSEVGSVIAYEYELRESQPYEPARIWRFQESIPVMHTSLEVRLPEGWTHQVQWKNYAPVQPKGRRWQLVDVPLIPDETRMPSSSSVAGRMGVQWIAPAAPPAGRSWKDIGEWYSRLAATRLAATPAVQATTRTLTTGAVDPARVLARFAQRDVRYVAVEIGIGGYQPHAAGEIFTNRYGDCKDKATLLKAMLKEAGIESYYVIVNTNRGMVDPSFASIASFDHVISAIRLPKGQAPGLHAVIDHPRLGTLLLFDPTSTNTQYGLLPSYLQASRGLLVTPDGGELIDMPTLAPEASELRRTARLTLDADGTLHGTVEEVRTGDVAAEMRGWLQPLKATERVHFVQESLSSHVARPTTTDVTIEHLDDPEADLVIRYRLSAPGYATSVADMILIRPRVIGAKGSRTIAMADRKHSYVTEGPTVQTDDVEIAMPKAIKLDELPKAVQVSNPLVQYRSSSAFENGVLRYQRRYSMHQHVVERDAIPTLNEAFARIAADERASAVFK